MTSKLFLAVLLALTFTGVASIADSAYWTEWQQLKDKAYDGLSFSYINDCRYEGDTSCSLNWGFKNGYKNEVDISYTIGYLAADGSRAEHKSTAHLKTGANELHEFKLTGRKLLSVTAEVLVEKHLRTKLDAELARKQQERLRKEEEARLEQERQQRIASAATLPYQPGEDPTVTDYRDQQRQAEEASRLAMLRYEEDRQREQEAKEEEARKDERLRAREQALRQEAEEDEREYKRQINASVQEFNNGMQQIIDRNQQTIANVYERDRQRQQDLAATQQRQQQNELRQQREEEQRQTRERERIRVAEVQRQEQQRLERERQSKVEAEKVQQRQENNVRWLNGSYKVNAGGSDSLYLETFVFAYVCKNFDDPAFYGQYLCIENKSSKYNADYATHNHKGSLRPGEKKILSIPFNNGPGKTIITEYQLNLRYAKEP